MNTIVENIEHELNLAIQDIKQFSKDTDPTAQNIVEVAKSKLERFRELADSHDCKLGEESSCVTCELVREIESVL